ncbi:hypothetical protein [Catenovulum agarivorans]|uniref:hypothetical protein n=1 Tax=Catenovulum agarivorans TaxID=1172192 RepID=UPI0004B90F50|nr:hypothetical protein [Catenovulum agarivorans]
MNNSSRGISLTTVAFAVLVMAITAMFNTATAHNGETVASGTGQAEQLEANRE